MAHFKGSKTVRRITINELPSFPKGQLQKEITAFDREMRIMNSLAYKKAEADKMKALEAARKKKNKDKED